jgi:murein DD-endopeptidase MepM/ murein hydrolase activator NlpD
MKTKEGGQNISTGRHSMSSVFYVFTALVMTVYLFVCPISAYAAKDEVGSFRLQNAVDYSGDCDTNSNSKSTTPTATGSGAGANCAAVPLPASIPEYWRNLIDQTAAQYPDVDRRTVAAELWVENRGWPDPNKQWATSSSSAKGPWQFIPSTWASMATDGDGDGVADINNPKDEVHAAFKHNKGTACKPILEGATGNAQADYDNVPFVRDGTNTLMSSIANYNGSGTDDGVAIGKQGRGQNPDYVKMAYWLIATDFKQTIDVETGQMIDATSAGAAANTAATPVANQPGTGNTSPNCAPAATAAPTSTSNSNGNGSSTGQFANPLPTGILTDCYETVRSNGQHLAIDLSDVGGSGPGGPALASDGGVVTLVENGNYGGYGKTVIVKHSNGYYTRYSHLSSTSVAVGDNVTKGQPVGITGSSGLSGGTHLDFGISKNPAVPRDATAENPLNHIDRSTINGASQCE